MLYIYKYGTVRPSSVHLCQMVIRIQSGTETDQISRSFSLIPFSPLSLFFLLFILFHFVLVLTDDDLETCLPKIGKKPHRSARSISNDGGPHSCVRDSRTWHKLKRRPLDELWPRVVRPTSQISFRYVEMTMMIRAIRIFRDDKSYANPSRKKEKKPNE